MPKSKGLRTYGVINEITSMLAELLLILIGGFMVAGKWTIPLFEATGNKTVGWVLLIVGALFFFGSVGQLVMLLNKKLKF